MSISATPTNIGAAMIRRPPMLRRRFRNLNVMIVFCLIYYLIGIGRRPYTPGSIGPVAGVEAAANLRTQLFIAPAALIARSCEPGIEAAPRDTERPAQPHRFKLELACKLPPLHDAPSVSLSQQMVSSEPGVGHQNDVSSAFSVRLCEGGRRIRRRSRR